MFAICVKAIIYLLHYNLHDCIFKVLGFWTVEHHCRLSSLYSTWNKEIHPIHWAVFIKTLRLALISDFWNLVSNSLLLENIEISGSANFTRKRYINVLSKQVLRKWMHVLSLGELQQITDTWYVRKVSYCYWCLYLHVTLFRMHVPLDGTHLVAVRGLIHQEVPTRMRQREEFN